MSAIATTPAPTTPAATSPITDAFNALMAEAKEWSAYQNRGNVDMVFVAVYLCNRAVELQRAAVRQS